MNLGVLLFVVALVVATFAFLKAVQLGDRFPVARFVLVEMAFIGFLINSEVGWWVYLGVAAVLTGFTFCLAALASSQYGWQYVLRTTAVAAAIFGALSLVFAVQPAPPLAALWIVVPGLICLIPPVNRQIRRLNDKLMIMAQEDAETRTVRDEKKASREAWLARR